MFLAGVAHPVERHLAKVEVASSSLVTRSIKPTEFSVGFSFKKCNVHIGLTQQIGIFILFLN